MMIRLRARSLFNAELALILGVGIASIPAVLPQAQADSVVGGGKCVWRSFTQKCKDLGNNGSACLGSWTETSEDDEDGLTKEMKTEKWCSGCDSEATQFDLKAGCVGTRKMPTPTPVEVP